MKELEILKIINTTLSQNSHIGDDCAYLKEYGLAITHDSMAEDIHFSREYSTPYQLGYKAVSINLSDIFASGAKPKYLTISLSLPKNIDKQFIKDFYQACEELSKKYDFEVIGGDITGAEKIFISICALGSTNGRNISSRANAKVGDYVVTTGNHGSSAAGLWILEYGEDFEKFKTAHLLPAPQENFSREISTKTTKKYAMMDTSDGLADALFKIAEASAVTINVNFEKIPYDKDIEKIAKLAQKDYKDWIFYGGEDFQLVACLSEQELKKLDPKLYTIIGRVEEKDENATVKVNFEDKTTEINDLEQTFNHFNKEKK